MRSDSKKQDSGYFKNGFLVPFTRSVSEEKGVTRLSEVQTAFLGTYPLVSLPRFWGKAESFCVIPAVTMIPTSVPRLWKNSVL